MMRRRWTSRVMSRLMMVHYVMTMVNHLTMMNGLVVILVMVLGHRDSSHGKQYNKQ